MVHRSVHLLFAAVFVGAALWQWRDADALAWAGLLLLSALVSVGAFDGNRPPLFIAATVFVLVALWSRDVAGSALELVRRGDAQSLFATGVNADRVVEEAREFILLVLCALATAVAHL